jgi:hypothetical protein
MGWSESTRKLGIREIRSCRHILRKKIRIPIRSLIGDTWRGICMVVWGRLHVGILLGSQMRGW